MAAAIASATGGLAVWLCSGVMLHDMKNFQESLRGSAFDRLLTPISLQTSIHYHLS